MSTKLEFNRMHYDEKENVNEYDLNKIKKIAKMAASFSPGKIMDIGCRPVFSKIIAEETGADVLGVNILDFSKLSGKKAKFIVGDAEKKFKIKDNSFDLVFCGELIEHLFSVKILIKEVRRVLKRNGILIITTPNLACLWNRFFVFLGYQPYQFQPVEGKHYGNPFLKWDNFRGHIKMFTSRSIKEFLKDNDFEIVKTIGSEYGSHDQKKTRAFLRKIVSRFPSISENIIVVARNKKD